MTSKPLATIITAPSLRYFGDDAAVPDLADPNAEIIGMEMPDIDLAGDVIAGKSEPPPVVDPPDVDPAKPAPPAAPAKPTTPPSEPPAKQLRTELDAVKKERDELKATLEKGDPRLVEAERVLREKQEEVKTWQEKAADYEKRLALGDPAVTAKLRELDDKYTADSAKFYNSVPELDSRTVHDLTAQFHQLPFGKPEYRQARAEFEATVNEALGAGEGSEHRKLEKALEFIEKTREVALERPRIEKEINESAFELRRQSEVQKHGAKSESARSRIAAAREVPDGLDKTDPFHPKVVLNAFAKSLPAEEVAKMEQGIDEFVELVVAGVKPRSEKDYAGMTTAAVAESKKAELQRMDNAREASVDVMVTGLRSLRLMPALVKENQRLREKLKEINGAAPPDPTAPGGGNGTGASDDVGAFTAPSLAGVDF